MAVVYIDKVVKRIRQIPPLPMSAMRLVETVSKKDHSIADVTRIVENDSNITAFVLKVANSAFAAQKEPVKSVKQAVLLLGESMIVNTALLVCSGALFDKSLAGYEAERRALWKHSLATAIASRMIAKFAKSQQELDAVYTAGIMHDIGKVVISEFLADVSGEARRMMIETPGEDFLSGERELLGTDHCEAGAMLGKKWNFPAAIISAIRFHHHPDKADTVWKPLVYSVHVADALAMLNGTATGTDALKYRIDEKYREHVSFSPGEMEKVMLMMELELEKYMSLMFGDSEGR